MYELYIKILYTTVLVDSATYNWKFIPQQQCKIVYKSLPCCCVCSIFIIVHSQGNV